MQYFYHHYLHYELYAIYYEMQSSQMKLQTVFLDTNKKGLWSEIVKDPNKAVDKQMLNLNTDGHLIEM